MAVYRMSKTMYKALRGDHIKGARRLTKDEIIAYINSTFGLCRKITDIKFDG